MQIKINTRGMNALSTLLSDRLDAARKRAAEQVADRARELAPVATGDLSDSIHVDENGRVVAASPHAIFVEMGTSRRAATPFLAPAALALMPEFESTVAEVVREVARGV